MGLCWGRVGTHNKDCDGEVVVGDKAVSELKDRDEVAYPGAREQCCMWHGDLHGCEF